MRASLTLICQGETAASRGSHFPCDDPLEAREWQRARQLQSSAARYHRVWFAPDVAARQTAAALSLQGTPVTELAEPDYGIWAGRPVHEVMIKTPKRSRPGWRVPLPRAESHVLSCWRAVAAGWLNTSIFEVATVPLRLPPQSAPRSSTFSAPRFTHLRVSTSTR